MASCTLFSVSVFAEWEVPANRHKGMPLYSKFEWCQLKYAVNISFPALISCQLFKTHRLSFSFRRSRGEVGEQTSPCLNCSPCWIFENHWMAQEMLQETVWILLCCYNKKKKRYFWAVSPSVSFNIWHQLTCKKIIEYVWGLAGPEKRIICRPNF